MAISQAFCLAIAGGLGTLARAGVAAVAVRWCGCGLPWGTLAVNVLGSFLFGLIMALSRGRLGLPTGLETVLLVGFLGGFTTYSSFAFQSYELMQQGRVFTAAMYVLATTFAALVAVGAGLLVGRNLVG